jgi:hypothetical protein
MIRDSASELLEIVKANGGGNFTASVYLREDGFFILFNEPFLDRIARGGRADRFCELLKTHFEEALRDATEKSKRSPNGGQFAREDKVSCVQVGDKRGRCDTAHALGLSRRTD